MAQVSICVIRESLELSGISKGDITQTLKSIKSIDIMPEMLVHLSSNTNCGVLSFTFRHKVIKALREKNKSEIIRLFSTHDEYWPELNTPSLTSDDLEKFKQMEIEEIDIMKQLIVNGDRDSPIAPIFHSPKSGQFTPPPYRKNSPVWNKLSTKIYPEIVVINNTYYGFEQLLQMIIDDDAPKEYNEKYSVEAKLYQSHLSLIKS